MAQTTRGGRELIDQMLADLADIDATAAISRKDVIFNPHGAADALEAIRDAVAALRGRIRTDLPVLLERAERNREAASLPDRVASLEAALADLHARLPALRIVERERKEG